MTECVNDFKDLKVWKKAYELAVLVYSATKKFPKEELYGITGQMRRSSVSTPSNIAEGYRRKHTGDYIRFLGIAFGSLAELETQSMLSQEFGYFVGDDFKRIMSVITEVSKMLNSLINSLECQRQ